MRAQLWKLLMLTALLTSSTEVEAASWVDSDCSNTRASQVDGRTENEGGTIRCGFGIKIFGIGGGLFGPECPRREVTYPSHQVCLGEESRGTYCLPAGNIPVVAKECRCDSATFLGTGVLMPSCSCTTVPDGGHVEDAQTYPCPVIVIGDTFEFP